MSSPVCLTILTVYYMKKTTALTLSLILFLSCQQDVKFQSFVESFQPSYQEHFRVPTEPLVIINLEKINKDLAFCEEQLQILKTFDNQKLSPDNQEKWQKIQVKLERKISQIQAFQTEPDSYNIYPAFQKVLHQKNWSLEKKLSIWKEQLLLTPLFYQTAIENLQDVDVKNAKETWDAHIKTFMFLNQELPTLLKQSGWSRLDQYSYSKKINTAEVAVKDYIAFCRSVVLNR